MGFFEVPVSFEVTPPHTRSIHDAMIRVRSIGIEAPTAEAAEHYANEVVRAIENEGNRGI